jgi:hypothetical protein
MQKRLLTLMTVLLFSSISLFGKTLVSVNGHKITDKIIPPGYEKLNETQKNNLIEQLTKEEVLYQDLLKSSIVRDPQFTQAFEQQKQVAEQQYQQKTGKSLNKEQIRAIKGSIALALYQQQAFKKAKISASEIKSYYNNNPQNFKMPDAIEIANIVVKSVAEGKQILKELKGKRGKALDEAFINKAHEYQQNGYVGWLFKGNAPEKLFNRAYKYKVKRLINSPVKVKDTYNVVYLLNKKRAGKIPFKDAKVRVEQLLKQQKVMKALREKVERLYGQAEIILY